MRQYVCPIGLVDWIHTHIHIYDKIQHHGLKYQRAKAKMSTSRNSSNPKRSRSLILSGLSSRTTQAMVDISLATFSATFF